MEEPRVEPAPAADQPSALFRLYFVRHAHAGKREDWEGPDEARPLTSKGRRVAKDGGKALRGLVGTPHAILSSPYARAQETAELLAKHLRFTGQIELHDTLVHGGDPRSLGKILEGHAGERDLVLVGHSPDLERWITWLTTGRDEPVFLELRKSGVCRVDVDALQPDPRGTVKWVLPPSVLRD
jgi:phosphohistidine phosphatase